MCLSPLLFDEFYVDAIVQGEEPIMSEQAYKFIYTFQALAVFPGAIASTFVFERFGVAKTCTLANFLTAFGIVALFYVATIEPATSVTFGGAVAILYLFVPVIIMSQISTGPMLNRYAFCNGFPSFPPTNT